MALLKGMIVEGDALGETRMSNGNELEQLHPWEPLAGRLVERAFWGSLDAVHDSDSLNCIQLVLSLKASTTVPISEEVLHWVYQRHFLPQ